MSMHGCVCMRARVRACLSFSLTCVAARARPRDGALCRRGTGVVFMLGARCNRPTRIDPPPIKAKAPAV